MTGRRLYDALTDGWADQSQPWNRMDGKFLQQTPPAWSFLAPHERKTFNTAARTLTPKPKKAS